MAASGDDTDYDDDLVPPSQTQHEMYSTIKESFGHLPKDAFKLEMSSRYKEDDLAIYRTGLYVVAREKVVDTPEGKLVMRKDTSNSGGATALMKLSEDIYNILHYIEGDFSFDITKLFTERSKVSLRGSKQRSIAQTITDNESTMAARGSTIALEDVCVQLLQEMRQDRDVIRNDLSEVKKNSALIQQVQKDMEQIRSSWHTDMMKMENRLTSLETKWAQSKPDVDQGRRNSQGVADTQQHRTLSEETRTLRQLYAENVQRINGLELSVTQLRSSVSLVAQHDYQLSILSGKVGLLQQPTAHQHVTRPKSSTATIRSTDMAGSNPTKTYPTSLAIH